MNKLFFMLGIVGVMVAEAAPPNILWIVSDDHSAAHVGVYGDPNVKTPNIDALAGQGMRFDRAYVTSPQCLPSRASFVTGRGSVGMNMTRFTTPLPPECVTFPETLRSNGWFVGFAGRPHHLQGWSYTTNIPPLFAKHGLLTVSNRYDFVRESNHGTAESRREEFFQQLDEFFAVAPTNRPFFLQNSRIYLSMDHLVSRWGWRQTWHRTICRKLWMACLLTSIITILRFPN